MRQWHPSRRLAAGILAIAVTIIVGGLGVPPASAAAATGTAPELEALKQRLDRLAEQGKAGKAQYWYIDTAARKVHVAVLRGGADLATTSFLEAGRPGLTVTRMIAAPVTPFVGTTKGTTKPGTTKPGTATRAAPTVYGGQQITAGDVYCSTGFNVDRGGRMRTLTAGHCRKLSVSWNLDGRRFGDITAYNYPGGDVSEITPEADWQLASAVRRSDGSIQPINSLGRPSLNQRLCKTGATTGTTCGVVTALDVTVNYGDGPVYGLAQTTVQAGPGDSGGSVYDSTRAIALISGGPRGGGESFVYPPF
ncbi:S1 family peptidase [Streptosporangium soli]|nr:S1 family peptidase [Streptosporangium sp. KLBMP 9127]